SRPARSSRPTSSPSPRPWTCSWTWCAAPSTCARLPRLWTSRWRRGRSVTSAPQSATSDPTWSSPPQRQAADGLHG
ncbi:unnamed protein product, partial [Prorocentrum cordatum]